MKQTLPLLLIISLLSSVVIAQSRSNPLISIGLAVGKYGKFDRNFKSSDETNYPSIIIQAEKGWYDNVNVGVYAGYSGQKHDNFSGANGEIKHNFYRVGALLSYNLNNRLDHMNMSPGSKWDVYTSLKTGFSLRHRRSESVILDTQNQSRVLSNSDSSLLFDLGIILGGRYYFSNSVALFSELGWGNAGLLTFGASFFL